MITKWILCLGLLHTSLLVSVHHFSLAKSYQDHGKKEEAVWALEGVLKIPSQSGLRNFEIAKEKCSTPPWKNNEE